MNIKFLVDCYNDKSSEYYLIEHFDVPCVIRVPTVIFEKRTRFGLENANELQLLEVRGLLQTPIDGNYFLKYTFSQTGISIGSVVKFTKIKVGCVKKFMEKFNGDGDYYFFQCILFELNEESINKN